MQDLHKQYNRKNPILLEYYNNLIQSAREYVNKYYSIKICHSEDEEYPKVNKIIVSEVWKIKIDKPISCTLLISIPINFPDVLPKIFLSKKSKISDNFILHIDTNNFICTLDENNSYINDNKVGEAMISLIKKAINIIKTGIKKFDNKSYLSEFLAYWDLDSKYTFLSLFTPGNKIEKLKLFALSIKLCDSSYIIAKTEDEVLELMDIFNFKIVNESNILYMPLSNPKSKNSFNTYDDTLKIVNKNKRMILSRYLHSENSIQILLFSFKYGGDRIYAGWKYHNFNNYIKKAQNGYRKGKIPLSLLFNRIGKHKIVKISIKRIDKDRLFFRGGIGSRVKKDLCISIIGCGSLGGQLAFTLAKCGFSKFKLIDNDSISIENIARHICNFDFIGKNKAVAVKEKLIKHFPYIKCDVHKDDILNCLLNDETFFNQTDIIISVIGNYAVERRINYLIKKGIITVPTLFVWIEPYGIGGHIVNIDNKFNGCLDCCFDENKVFKYSIIKNPEKYIRQESGCQSTFMPYASLEIDYFINFVTKYIIEWINGNKINCNEVISWIGDLNLAKKYKLKLNDQWVTDNSYTFHENKIIKNNYCENCNV